MREESNVGGEPGERRSVREEKSENGGKTRAVSDEGGQR